MHSTPSSPEVIVHNEAKIFRDKYKWWFLLLVELGQFFIIYSVGGISTLQRQFEKIMGLTELDYTHLIQSVSIPGLILPLFIGVLIDHYGASAGLISGITITSIGQYIVAHSISRLSYWSLVIGVVIKSSGSRVYYLAKSKMIRVWYQDHEMGKVTSISAIVSTLAGITGDVAYPNIFQYTNSLSAPFYVAFVAVCVVSFISLIQTYLHWVLMKHVEVRARRREREQLSISKVAGVVSSFPSIFWLVVFVSAFLHVTYAATRMYQSKFLQTSFGYSPGDAGIILGSGLAISGCMSVLVGFFVDRFGRIPQVISFGIIVIGAGIAGNAYVPKCDKCYYPLIPLAFLSLGSGIEHVVVTTAKMKLLPEKQIGLAFAIYSTVSSVFTLIYPAVVGEIAQRTYSTSGYHYVYLANLGMAFFTFGLSLWLVKADNKHNKILQRVEEAGDEERLLQSTVELENKPMKQPEFPSP